jgi:hypothetical protein
MGGHDPESGRSVTGEFFFVLLQNGQLETEGMVYFKEKVMRAEGGWI